MKSVGSLASHTAVLDATNPALEQEASVLVSSARALVVTDNVTCTLAGERLMGLATLKKRIEDWFGPLVDQAHRIHKELTTRRRQALEPVDVEVSRLKGSLGAYVTAREAERRRAELDAQAEAQRLEDERITRETEALKLQGQRDLAAAVMAEHLASPPPMVVLPSTTPRISGVSTVERFEYRVINEALVPRELCSPDPKKLRARVDAQKGATRIPGVQVWRQDTVRVRAF